MFADALEAPKVDQPSPVGYAPFPRRGFYLLVKIATASTSAAQALSVGREPAPWALTVGRLREPGPACGRSGRWHAVAARGEIAIRATAAPVRDRQRFGVRCDCDGGDQDRDDGGAGHGAPRLPRDRPRSCRVFTVDASGDRGPGTSQGAAVTAKECILS